MKPMFRFMRPQEQEIEPELHRGNEDEISEFTAVGETREDEESLDQEFSRPANVGLTRPDLGPPAPGPQSASQPGSGLGLIISVAIAAIVFVLAIYATGSPTANPLPLAQTTNALFWTVAVIGAAAAGIGAVYADRTASRARSQAGFGGDHMPTAWIVPLIATATSIVLVATFHNTTMIVAGPLIAFLGNTGSMLSRDLLDDADDSAQRTASTIHTLVIHSVGFLALCAIYVNDFRVPLAAFLAGAVTTLLALETLERAPIDPARRLVFSLLAGGAVAAAVAPLKWWLTYGLIGGAVLFVVFYCALGVIHIGLDRRGFRFRDGIEFGLIPLAAFIVLAIAA